MKKKSISKALGAKRVVKIKGKMDFLKALALNLTLANWKWPFQRYNLGGAKEYSCPHGIGHGGVHGCDGCCAHPSFPGRSE